MKKLLLITFLHLQITAFGQLNNNSQFAILNKADGLTSNTTNAFIQDRRGILWLATENGICSYNGTEFSALTPDNSSIPHSRIFDLAKDRRDDVWAGTGNGLCKINSRSRSLKTYNCENGYGELTDWDIRNVEIDSSGRIWFCNSTSLCLLDENRDTIISYPIHCETAPYIHCMKMGKDNNLWVSANNELIAFNRKTKKQAVLFRIKRHSQDEKNEIINRIECGSGRLWCSTNFGMLYERAETDTVFAPIPYPAGTSRRLINSLYYSDNILYVAVDKQGIYQYQWADKTGEYVTNKLFSIVDNRSVSCMFRDMHHNMWLSLHTAGIAYAAPYSKFQLYNSYSTRTSALESNNISALMIDGRSVFIGTDGGGMYLLSDKSFRKLDFAANEILSIDSPKGDGLWIGTYSDGAFLCQWQDKLLIKKQLSKNNGLIVSNDVRKTVTDNTGTLWFIVHGNGVCSYNPITKKTKNYSTKNGLSGDWTYSLAVDTDNTIWVATNNGLSSIGRNDKITIYNKQKDPLLPNDFIFSLYIDGDKLWCGSVAGYGIFDLTKKCFVKTVDKIQVSCHSIIADNSGYIWIGTDNGLAKLNKNGAIIENYLNKGELPASSFTKNCAAKDAEGNLFWGTTNGLLSFHPDSLHNMRSKPIFSINDILINNKSILTDQNRLIGQDERSFRLADLSYDENMIEFAFNIINYRNPAENMISYRLLGLDTAVIERINTRNILYNSLPPGNYTLEVSAANNGKLAADEKITVVFRVRPPYWETWWFRILILSAITFGITRYYSIKTRQIRKQKTILSHKVQTRTKELAKTLEDLKAEKNTVEEQNEELVQIADRLQIKILELDTANSTKNRLFSLISHDIRNPFTSILGLSELLDKNYDTYEEVQRKKLTNMIRTSSESIYSQLSNMLDWARGQLNNLQINPQHCRLAWVVKDTVSIQQPVAQNKNIDIQIHIDDHCAVYADIEMLKAIIRNLTSNAIKFTPSNGTVKISAQHLAGQSMTQITIADTGVGISPENIDNILNTDTVHSTYGTDKEPGTGLGIAICIQFVKSNNGRLEIESELGKGTAFKVFLPQGIAESADTEQTVCDEKTVPENPGEQTEECMLQPMKFKTVVLAEDNQNIREHLHTVLSRYFTVFAANDGTEAWRLIETHLPDIVLSDVAMPGMDGYELCGKIKQTLQTSHIPVMLITAQKHDNDRIKGLKTGANDYILKPYSITDILLKVKNMFEMTEQLKANYKFEEKDVSGFTNIDEKFLQKLTGLLESEYRNPELSVEQIGAEIGMSRSHFYKKCIALTGKSPSDMLQEIRVRNALVLLRKTDLPIADVADAVGYKDPRYFANRIKVFTGKTPSEIRSSK